MKGFVFGIIGAVSLVASAAMAAPAPSLAPAAHSSLVDAQVSIQVGPNHARFRSNRRGRNCRMVTTRTKRGNRVIVRKVRRC